MFAVIKCLHTFFFFCLLKWTFYTWRGKMKLYFPRMIARSQWVRSNIWKLHKNLNKVSIICPLERIYQVISKRNVVGNSYGNLWNLPPAQTIFSKHVFRSSVDNNCTCREKKPTAEISCEQIFSGEKAKWVDWSEIFHCLHQCDAKL